jgi:hypothetical protein
MIARSNALALKGLLLTGAAVSLTFLGSACLAQDPAPQSVPSGKYDGVETPQSLKVYAPLMSQSERDGLAIKIIILAAAGLGAIIALIVWRSMPPKAKPADVPAQTAPATTPNGASDSANSAPVTVSTEVQTGSTVEKAPIADSVAEANKAEVAEANTEKGETSDAEAPAEKKSDS